MAFFVLCTRSCSLFWCDGLILVFCFLISASVLGWHVKTIARTWEASYSYSSLWVACYECELGISTSSLHRLGTREALVTKPGHAVHLDLWYSIEWSFSNIAVHKRGLCSNGASDSACLGQGLTLCCVTTYHKLRDFKGRNHNASRVAFSSEAWLGKILILRFLRLLVLIEFLSLWL